MFALDFSVTEEESRILGVRMKKSVIMIVMKTFGMVGNQLGMRLLFLYLSCLGLSEAGNKIFHQIFNRSPPILSNSYPPC